MEITMDARALDELIQAVELAGGEELRAKTDAKIVKRAADEAKPKMEGVIPKAKDHSTSGRKGSRPSHGHAADNVPLGKPKKKDETVTATVGWTLGDNSEYFYMKFINWGTLKMPPRNFIDPTAQAVEQLLPSIAEEEYDAALRESLGRFE